MLRTIEAVRRYVDDKLTELNVGVWQGGGRPEHFLPLLGQKAALEELQGELKYNPEGEDE